MLVYVCTGGAGGSNRAGALRAEGWRLGNAFPVGYLDQPKKEDRFQGSSRATCARSPSSSVTAGVKGRKGTGEDEASGRAGAGWQRSGDQADFSRW